MTALTNKIGNDPVLFPLLDVFYSQGRQFGAPKTAAQENGKRRVVSLAAETVNVYGPQKTLPCSAESQLPTGIPNRLASSRVESQPLDRRSGVRNPPPHTPAFGLPRAAS